jgi:hypothetical protein
MSQIEATYLWQKRARPETDKRALEVALGCHLEEVCEMLESLGFEGEDDGYFNGQETIAFEHLQKLAEDLKAGKVQITAVNPKMFLDGIVDQLVTGTGVGYCANTDVLGALEEVNRSNYSKFVDGEPVFDANGKVTKGPDYAPPNLAPFLPATIHNIPTFAEIIQGD